MCDVPRENIVCDQVKAAKSLPTEVKDQACSSRFQEFLNEKEQQYRQLKKNMREEIKLVTVSIDDRIEKYAAVASEELSMLREEVGEEVLEVTTLEDLSQLTEQNQQRRLKIEQILYELSLDLESLEQSRSEDTKILMSRFKQDAIKLKHFSIDVIEKDLEAEIVDVNTQMFKNYQNIEDTKLQLRIQGDEIINNLNRTLVERTKVITEQHADQLRKEAEESHRESLLLEAMKDLSQHNDEAREIFTQFTADLFKKLDEFPAHLELPEEYDVSDVFWKHWTRSLNKKLEVLDKVSKNIKDLLNKSANTLLERFEEQISSISLKAHLQVGEQLDDGSEQEETDVMKRFNVLSRSTTDIRQDLQSRWQDTVDKITNEIDRAKQIISDFTSIWNNHLARFEKIRKRINESDEKSLAALMKNENAKIKVLKNKTKAAREAKDTKKLDDLCNKLEETYYLEIEKWDESFLAQRIWVEEVKSVEFENLIVEIESDIKTLLYIKHPKLDRFSEALFSKPRSSFILSEERELKVDERKDSYRTYLRAVENRCLGMYEMMERYLPQCAQILREEAEDWSITHIMQVLVPVYDTRILELKDTAKKEVNLVRKVRFAELQVHADRLVSHSLAVKEELSTLDDQMKEVGRNQQSVLREFNGRIGDLESENEKPLRTQRFVLQNQWQSIAEQLEESIRQAKAHFEAKIEDLNRANNSFSTTAKSFKSGGNYSPEEVKALKKQLTTLSKSIATQKKILTNKYNKMLNNVKSPVLESKMNLIEEELTKFSFKTEISDNLSILRMRLRSEIEIMKNKNQYFENDLHCLKKLRKIDSSLLKDVVVKIDLIVNYMKFPENIQNLECTKDKQDSIQSVETNVSKKSPKSTKKTDKSPPLKLTPLLRYANKLDNALQAHNNFFAKTKDIILRKYEILVNLIENSLKTQTRMSKSPSKKKNIVDDASRNELLQQLKMLKMIFRSYNSECETAWLVECKRFLELIKQLRDNSNEFASTVLNCVHDKYMTELNSVGNAFQPKRESFYRAEESKRNKKHFPLVLAHPNHEGKLHDWKKSVSYTCTEAISNFKDMLQQYTQSLQNMHDTYVSKVKVLKDHFNMVQNLVFDSEICKPLQENLSKISLFKPYKPSDEDIQEAYEMIPLSIWSDVDLSRNKETPSRRNVETTRSLDISSSLMSTLDVDIEVTKTPIDWRAIDMIKESGLTANKFFIDEATYFKRFEAETTEWFESLQTEIKQCQKLYNIEDVEKSILKKYCQNQ